MKKARVVGVGLLILFLLGFFTLPYILDIMESFRVRRTITINREASSPEAYAVLELIENRSIQYFLGNDFLKACDNVSLYMNNETLQMLLAKADTVEPYARPPFDYKSHVTLEWNVSVTEADSSLSTINLTTFRVLCLGFDYYFWVFQYFSWWQNGSLHSPDFSCGAVYLDELNETSFRNFSAPFCWIFKGTLIYDAGWGWVAGVRYEVTQLFLFNCDLDPVCLAYKYTRYVA
ncbi:MAG: hypothetical protein ACFFCW_41310 [Candidatus Hodarchaeota archaeon]